MQTMKACVLSPGVVHAVPRTVAIADRFDEVHFVDITGRSDAAELESHGVKYHGPGTPGGVIGRKELKKLFRQIAPDIIICHFASGDHYFNAIAFGDCPVAVIAMGQDVLYESGDCRVPHLRRLLIRMALRRSCYISAKSEYLARRIRQFRVKAPVEVNYWGADLERFSPGDRGEARQRLGWDEKKIYILSPRAVEPRLNIDVIVEAFSMVLKNYPEAMLVIIGRSNQDYLQQIREQISRLGISGNVSLQGEVTQEMLPVYYRASDMVLSMARSEGFPNTILEVMACRIPVIAGRLEQVGELLENGHNSIVCEISAEDIAASVKKLLDDAELAAGLSGRGILTVRENADIRKNGVIFQRNSMNCLLKRDDSMTIVKRYIFRFMYLIYCMQRKLIAA